LWRKTGELKAAPAMDYVEDLLEEGKILLFAHHQSILDAFEGRLFEHSIRFIRIDGRTPPSERQELCDLFQREASIRIALLSITAASVGLTLTAASTVVFAELFWNPGILIQAEDRAHRIGQTDCVNVHYLLAKGTVDDRIWPLILKKLSILESVGLSKNNFGHMAHREHDPSQQTIDKFFQ
jgi:SWI/SNF-related matrix-associated actin-dependent regulator of chromatin subfamily A-like protein 1